MYYYLHFTDEKKQKLREFKYCLKIIHFTSEKSWILTKFYSLKENSYNILLQGSYNIKLENIGKALKHVNNVYYFY